MWVVFCLFCLGLFWRFVLLRTGLFWFFSQLRAVSHSIARTPMLKKNIIHVPNIISGELGSDDNILHLDAFDLPVS